jgi:hypothetical protein
MVFCRLFLFISLLFSLSSQAGQGSLVLRAHVFPTIQISIAGGISEGPDNEVIKVKSNMEKDNYKVYQESRLRGDSSNKFRQLVVEAN